MSAIQYSKQYILEAARLAGNSRERLGKAVRALLSTDVGRQVLTDTADELFLVDGSQSKGLMALRAAIGEQSILVEKDGKLVRDKDAIKMTVGRKKNPISGSLEKTHEVRKAAPRKGGAVAVNNAKDKDALTVALSELVKVFGIDVVLEALANIEPQQA